MVDLLFYLLVAAVLVAAGYGLYLAALRYLTGPGRIPPTAPPTPKKPRTRKK